MKILTLCLVVFVLPVITPAAYGCDCATLTPEKAFDSAQMVFIGKMVSGTEKKVGVNKDGSQIALEAGDVTFEIEALETFKEYIGGRRTVIMKVPGRQGASGEPYGLVPGEKYFVYAYINSEDPGGTLQTGPCTRTALLTEAKEDIEFIRKLREIGYGTIKGYVSLNTHWLDSRGASYSLPKISLSIVGPDQFSRTTQIDKSGNFEVTGLKAGNYRLSPQMPDDYESTKESEEVTIAGFVTHYSSFTAQYKSLVSGTIQDVSGAGFDQSAVYLENSTTRVPGGSLDPDGRFEIKGVPPGEYVMYMEFRSEDLYATRKYYYPGTYDAALATKLKVGLSDSKSGLKFTLPGEFRVRKVSGTIFWPDGKVAQGVTVFLSCPESSKYNYFRPENSHPIMTDKNGQFSLNGIDGLTYWLQVLGQDKAGTPAYSVPVRIDLTKDLTGMKFVLSKRGFSSGCPIPKEYPVF